MEKERKVIDTTSPERIPLTDWLFDELYPVMNQIHDMNASRRFWFMLIEEHVRAMVSRKHLLDKHEVNIYPTLYPINGYTFPSLKQQLIYNAKQTVKHFQSRRNQKRITTILRENDRIAIGFPDMEKIGREKKGVSLPDYKPLLFGGGDRQKRELSDQIASVTENVYLKNVIKQLPKALVEYFSHLFSLVELVEPRKKEFHVHGLMNFTFKQFIIAMYTEQGASLFWYQHGAGYGEIELKYSRFLEYTVADKYITWGWKLAEKDQPGEAFRLEVFKEKYDGTGDKVKAYDLLICYPAINSGNRMKIQKLTEELLHKLDRNKFRNILARPRPSHSKHSHAGVLPFLEGKGIDISTGLNPITNEMRQSEVVLQFKVPSTNFQECIYSKHPVIGLLDNPKPTQIVSPHYRSLQEMGLLHEGVQSLCEHLNKTDMHAWWNYVRDDARTEAYINAFASRVI